MKTCPSCGEALSDEAKFCPVDGTSLQSVPSTPGAPPAPVGASQFARTLYGAVPPPPVMAAPPDPRIDPDAVPEEPVRIGSAAPDDLDMSVTPSDHLEPVPVKPAPTAAPPAPAISIERLPSRGPRRSKDSAGSSSFSLQRPKSPVGLAIGAAIGGAALVSVLALGVKALRGNRAKKAEVAHVATPPTPAVPTPPAPPPAPPPTPSPAVAPSTPDASTPPPPTTEVSPAVAPTGPASPPTIPAPTPPAPEPQPRSGGDPRQADIYLRAGNQHLSRGAYGKAREAFEQARAFDPTNAAALAGLGEAAFEQGQYETAVSELRAATRLDRNSRYLTMLGNAYFKLRQFKQAVEQYKKALQLDPKSTEAAEGLAASQKKLRGG